LRKGWAKIQPFEKRLGQNINLLRKGWAKIQPFEKRLGQNINPTRSVATLFFIIKCIN